MHDLTHYYDCVHCNTVNLSMLDCSPSATLQIIQWRLLPLHIKPLSNTLHPFSNALCGPGQRELLNSWLVKFPLQRGSKEARGEEEGRVDGGEKSVMCTFRVWDIIEGIDLKHFIAVSETDTTWHTKIIAAATRLLGLYIKSKENEFDIHVNPNSCTAQLWSKNLWLLVLSLRNIHQWPYGQCEWLIRNLPQKGHNRNVQMQKLECILGLNKSPCCICVLQSCYPHDDLLEQVVSTLLMTTAMWHSHESLMNHHITLSLL